MRRMFSLEQLKNIADQRVTALITGGTLDNAKAIYYHPISIYKTDVGAFSFIIIDNSNEEYNTATKLKNKIANFTRISPISGGWIVATNKCLIAAYAYKAGTSHILMGAYTDGTIETGSGAFVFENIIDSAESIADGVNKIN